MNQSFTVLDQWLASLAFKIEQQSEMNMHLETELSFVKNPEFFTQLIQHIQNIDENSMHESSSYYSACIYSFDLCIAQLQLAHESGNLLARRLLKQLMHQLTAAIHATSLSHGITFWLPMLNAFYEAKLELSPELQDAYVMLAEQEEDASTDQEIDPLTNIRDMIDDLSDLSVFDMADNFFAQSYAMPPDFFAEFILDLCHVKEGIDIAVLALLHPNSVIRELVFHVLEQMMDDLVISSISLTRLQTIRHWLPQHMQINIDGWIKQQRKKGVVFYHYQASTLVKISATAVDGSGSQGIYIEWKHKTKRRLSGILLKVGTGVKDAWLSPLLSKQELHNYLQNIINKDRSLRVVSGEYMLQIINHFVAISLQQQQTPPLHLLEIQEQLAQVFKPELIDYKQMLHDLCINIHPFTPTLLYTALKNSKTWCKKRSFTSSWIIENPAIDILINQCSFLDDGVRVCSTAQAIKLIMEKAIEPQRAYWCFHFLWMALWLKADGKKADGLSTDLIIIAHVINENMSLHEIPIMQSICEQSVANSIETMHERNTHLGAVTLHS